VGPLLLEQVRSGGSLRLVVGVDGFAPRVARVPNDDGRLEAKPKIAFVGIPVEVAIDSGRAKKAR